MIVGPGDLEGLHSSDNRLSLCPMASLTPCGISASVHTQFQSYGAHALSCIPEVFNLYEELLFDHTSRGVSCSRAAYYISVKQ